MGKRKCTDQCQREFLYYVMNVNEELWSTVVGLWTVQKLSSLPAVVRLVSEGFLMHTLS